MAPIRCSAPDCVVTFDEGTPADTLLVLVQLHARTAHPTTPPAQPTSTKAEKVKRPVIVTSGTSEDWAYFCSRWKDYKKATKLQAQDVVFQLLECCEEDLRKDLTRSFDDISDMTEDDALNAIKTLAVKPENIMVARVQLQNLHQQRDLFLAL